MISEQVSIDVCSSIFRVGCISPQRAASRNQIYMRFDVLGGRIAESRLLIALLSGDVAIAQIDMPASSINPFVDEDTDVS